jgi:hypothetical protein
VDAVAFWHDVGWVANVVRVLAAALLVVLSAITWRRIYIAFRDRAR